VAAGVAAEEAEAELVTPTQVVEAELVTPTQVVEAELVTPTQVVVEAERRWARRREPARRWCRRS